MHKLPDGSGFFVGSFPLPKDHWLYAPNCAEWDSVRDTSADTPRPIFDKSQREAVKAAIRWAVRGATMNGTEPDFDPDALVLNAAYALCGPCGDLTPKPKFANVFCSQCGQEFGPGDHGFSHCENHKRHNSNYTAGDNTE